MPVIIRVMSDDETVINMVDSNLQRQQITFSEKAFAYKMKNGAMKRTGNSENLTEKQKEVLGIWNNLSTNEQETVMSMLRGLRK